MLGGRKSPPLFLSKCKHYINKSGLPLTFQIPMVYLSKKKGV